MVVMTFTVSVSNELICVIFILFVCEELPLTHDENDELRAAKQVWIDSELLNDQKNEGEVIKVIQTLSSTTYHLGIPG
jgi:hypothetical protein